MATKEVHKLLRSLDKLTNGQATIDFHGNDTINEFYLYITPNDGLYKDATVKFKVVIPKDYPTHGPRVLCMDKIFHPNIIVSKDFSVCVNLLKGDWQPTVGLDGAVQALVYLFHHPNFDDPFGTEIMDAIDKLEEMDWEKITSVVHHACNGGTVLGIKYDNIYTNTSKMSKEDRSRSETSADFDILRSNSNTDRLGGITSSPSSVVQMQSNATSETQRSAQPKKPWYLMIVLKLTSFLCRVLRWYT